MNDKQKTVWQTIKEWFHEFNDDKTPWQHTPAADILTLMHEVEQPDMSKKERLEKILQVLDRQTFADFYAPGGDFENYIQVDYPEGHPKHMSREMILNKIEKLFNSVL